MNRNNQTINTSNFQPKGIDRDFAYLQYNQELKTMLESQIVVYQGKTVEMSPLRIKQFALQNQQEMGFSLQSHHQYLFEMNKTMIHPDTPFDQRILQHRDVQQSLKLCTITKDLQIVNSVTRECQHWDEKDILSLIKRLKMDFSLQRYTGNTSVLDRAQIFELFNTMATRSVASNLHAKWQSADGSNSKKFFTQQMKEAGFTEPEKYIGSILDQDKLQTKRTFGEILNIYQPKDFKGVGNLSDELINIQNQRSRNKLIASCYSYQNDSRMFSLPRILVQGGILFLNIDDAKNWQQNLVKWGKIIEREYKLNTEKTIGDDKMYNSCFTMSQLLTQWIYDEENGQDLDKFRRAKTVYVQSLEKLIKKYSSMILDPKEVRNAVETHFAFFKSCDDVSDFSNNEVDKLIQKILDLNGTQRTKIRKFTQGFSLTNGLFSQVNNADIHQSLQQVFKAMSPAQIKASKINQSGFNKSQNNNSTN